LDSEESRICISLSFPITFIVTRTKSSFHSVTIQNMQNVTTPKQQLLSFLG